MTATEVGTGRLMLMVLALGFCIHSKWFWKRALRMLPLAFTATDVGKGRMMLMMLALGRSIHSRHC